MYKGSASEAKLLQSKTYCTGLVIQKLRMGIPNGEQAIRGKKLAMSYIGMLENGETFDADTGWPFYEFRLGARQAILGWEVGVKGMRVGEKRRLIIPPFMGYGTKGAGSIIIIPPNSWLIFDLELRDVK
uniref:peptidyl-prolyl cis-trans isomerase FKBP53-like n=1 Tax=Erigeron canadensis TaxID=72917 RepID=UPI001CB95CAF|nr:peptidyl-prolyl cis-trans isomerase FKBP53-like [Erigeron canadensis]